MIKFYKELYLTTSGPIRNMTEPHTFVNTGLCNAGSKVSEDRSEAQRFNSCPQKHSLALYAYIAQSVTVLKQVQ